MINKGVINFFILSLSCIEIPINKNKEAKTKKRCFVKKKYVSLFILSAATDDVDEKEKNKPNNKRKINKNRNCLSIFLHHLANKPVFSLPKLNIFFYNFFKIITSLFKISELIK